MRTARSYSVPLSVFRAWEPSDQVAAMSLQLHEDGLCAGCGNALHETTDHRFKGKWGVPNPTRCEACTAILRKKKQYEQQDGAEALMFMAGLPEGYDEEVDDGA